MHKPLSAWLRWQQALNSSVIDMGLERVGAVARNCGLSDVRCPVITVAGTNGKGSTVAFLTAILTQQGYRVGSYTSPHLHRYNERICVNGEPASDEMICRAFETIERHRDDHDLTFFEFGTLAALKCFADAEIDVMVLEVGLGGRLDAVNIITPSVSVITSIGLDHIRWLGKDRESIAIEKLGITRKNTPLVSGDPDPPCVIRRHAHKIKAPLYQLGEQFDCRRTDDNHWEFIHKGNEAQRLLRPGLLGDMQLRNASCALMTLHLMRDRLPVSKDAIEKGVVDAHICGRFQVERQGRLIYDIAHNPDSVYELSCNLQGTASRGRLHAVFGALKDKDIDGIFNIMREHVHRWYLASPDNKRALPIDGLSAAALRAGISRFQVCENVADAYDIAWSHLPPDDTLLIFGSVFVVAEGQDAAGAITGA